MNPMDQLIAAFQKTFEDEVFSRNERKALKAMLGDMSLDQRKKDVLRSKVFDIAEQGLATGHSRFVLEWAEDASRLIDKLGEGDTVESRVYFSPGDECKDAIITQIRSARRALDICVFTISDNDISDAIIDRHRLGTPVRIITDNDKQWDRGSDVERLAEAGVDVRVDRTEYHMHHKFAVVNHEIALTGSYNWTRSAAKYNEENLLLTEDPKIVRSYLANFRDLWRKMEKICPPNRSKSLFASVSLGAKINCHKSACLPIQGLATLSKPFNLREHHQRNMKRTFYLLFFALASLFSWSQTPNWFSDVSADVGLATTPEALRLNVLDVNGDEYPDIVSVESVNRRNMIHVYLNMPDTSAGNSTGRMFVDWTDSSMVNVHPHPDSTGGRRSEIVSLADLDNDGDPDMISGIWHWDPLALNFPDDRSSVLLNDGTGRFTHVPKNGFEALGLISIAGLSFLDYDQDGNLDVYVATFSDDHPNFQFRQDYIMRGNGDGTFTQRPGPFDLNTVMWPNYGSSVTDFDNNGFQDIMTSPYCRDGGVFWSNLNGSVFQNMALNVNYDAQQMQGDGQDMCQWGAYPYDFDSDGDMDILQVLVHGGADAMEGRTTIAVNGGAPSNYNLTWELSRLRRTAPGSTHMGNMDASWADFDNDGLVDIVMSETEYHPLDRMYVYLQDSTHHFDDVTDMLGLTGYRIHTVESADIDLDGDYDLIMNVRNQGTQIRVLQNNIGTLNNYLAVNLDAASGVNQDAIGARIHVTSGGVTQMREVQAGLGHWGGQAPKLQIFGLGEETWVDSLWVEWPGGHVTTYYGLVPNQFVTIDGNLATSSSPAPVRDLALYPNPTTGQVNLVGWNFDQVEVRVFDMLGKMYPLNETHNRNQMRLRLDGMAPGMYLLDVRDLQTGQREIRRVVLE